MPKNWQLHTISDDGTVLFKHRQETEQLEIKYDSKNNTATALQTNTKEPTQKSEISIHQGPNCQYLALIDALHWMKNHPWGSDDQTLEHYGKKRCPDGEIIDQEQTI